MNLTPPIVVNLRNESYDRYIGRGSIWGNPFKIDANNTREDVIRLYERDIRGRSYLIDLIPNLAGLKLGCYCAPQACHGHVIVKIFMEWVRAYKGVRK